MDLHVSSDDTYHNQREDRIRKQTKSDLGNNQLMSCHCHVGNLKTKFTNNISPFSQFFFKIYYISPRLNLVSRLQLPPSIDFNKKFSKTLIKFLKIHFSADKNILSSLFNESLSWTERLKNHEWYRKIKSFPKNFMKIKFSFYINFQKS